VDIALPLSLIVNELISNSIKHAFQDGDQGSIDIYLRSDGGKVELKYKDSGKSFDQSKIQTEGGIGLKLIQLLSSQLKANLQDDLKNGSFHMIIPLS
jgi:two-component sensor histidine kinase